jgi:hypothetical protein
MITNPRDLHAGSGCQSRSCSASVKEARPLPSRWRCSGACGVRWGPWEGLEPSCARVVEADCAHRSGRAAHLRLPDCWAQGVLGLQCRHCPPLFSSPYPTQNDQSHPGHLIQIATLPRGRWLWYQAVLFRYPASCFLVPSAPHPHCPASAPLRRPCDVAAVSRRHPGVAEAGPRSWRRDAFLPSGRM